MAAALCHICLKYYPRKTQKIGEGWTDDQRRKHRHRRRKHVTRIQGREMQLNAVFLTGMLVFTALRFPQWQRQKWQFHLFFPRHKVWLSTSAQVSSDWLWQTLFTSLQHPPLMQIVLCLCPFNSITDMFPKPPWLIADTTLFSSILFFRFGPLGLHVERAVTTIIILPA